MVPLDDITTGIVGCIVVNLQGYPYKIPVTNTTAGSSTFVARLSIVCLISSQPPAVCFTIHPTSPVALPPASGINEYVMHFCAGTAHPTEVCAKAGAAKDGSDVQ